MMSYGDEHFFELPIYLESEERYYERFDRILEAKAKEAWQRSADPRKDLNWYRQRKRRLSEIYLRQYGGTWAYNQIFGFLGIYPLGDQLRGATWYSTKKLSRRDIKSKEIDFYAKAFELTIYPDQDSSEIFDSLMAEVVSLRQDYPYRRRYLETRQLELTGPFFDWRRLIDISMQCGRVRLAELPDLLGRRPDSEETCDC